MANLKNITELPIAESAEGLNLIVNDNGRAKQIPAGEVGAQADFAETNENSPAFIKNKPQVVQPDWNQNDETAPDYVKNKPFYIGYNETTLEHRGGSSWLSYLDGFLAFVVGDTVSVKIDGVEYSLVAFKDEGRVTIGDTLLQIDEASGPLGWSVYMDTDGIVKFLCYESHTVVYPIEYIYKIDSKFLPDDNDYDMIIQCELENDRDIGTLKVSDYSIIKPGYHKICEKLFNYKPVKVALVCMRQSGSLPILAMYESVHVSTYGGISVWFRVYDNEATADCPALDVSISIIDDNITSVSTK